ncbi:MAG: AEC family transporter [Pseudomonadota bacterium]
MLALLQVVAPVFLVTAAGYLCVRLKYFKDSHIDGLNRFTQNFAIPVLLFNATWRLDLGAVFDPALLLAFYAGNTIAFVLGIIGARLFFKRRPGESVAIGFGALFSNSVILGIPIVDRAFGPDALAASFAVIAIHAPFCYVLGITVMEISRADGRNATDTARAVIRAMLKNALMIGILLGFAANLLGVSLPETVAEAMGLIVGAALPTAVFALGGVLTRYNMRRSVGEAVMIAVLSLIVHPTITFVLAYYVLDLPVIFVKGVVLTASMAPGINTYIFATMYQRAEGAAASTVLLATALSLISVSVWLGVLNGL